MTFLKNKLSPSPVILNNNNEKAVLFYKFVYLLND